MTQATGGGRAHVLGRSLISRKVSQVSRRWAASVSRRWGRGRCSGLPEIDVNASLRVQEIHNFSTRKSALSWSRFGVNLALAKIVTRRGMLFVF